MQVHEFKSGLFDRTRKLVVTPGYLTLLLYVLNLGIAFGGELDLDTIDNWQIYNGPELILAGSGLQSAAQLRATMNKIDLKTLEIQYNHCMMYSGRHDVIIDIIAADGATVFSKTFSIRAGDRIRLERSDVAPFASNIISIRYREKWKNGADLIIGQIQFLDTTR